jgi:hypothetical protein
MWAYVVTLPSVTITFNWPESKGLAEVVAQAGS